MRRSARIPNLAPLGCSRKPTRHHTSRALQRDQHRTQGSHHTTPPLCMPRSSYTVHRGYWRGTRRSRRCDNNLVRGNNSSAEVARNGLGERTGRTLRGWTSLRSIVGDTREPLIVACAVEAVGVSSAFDVRLTGASSGNSIESRALAVLANVCKFRRGISDCSDCMPSRTYLMHRQAIPQ